MKWAALIVWLSPFESATPSLHVPRFQFGGLWSPDTGGTRFLLENGCVVHWSPAVLLRGTSAPLRW